MVLKNEKKIPLTEITDFFILPFSYYGGEMFFNIHFNNAGGKIYGYSVSVKRWIFIDSSTRYFAKNIYFESADFTAFKIQPDDSFDYLAYNIDLQVDLLDVKDRATGFFGQIHNNRYILPQHYNPQEKEYSFLTAESMHKIKTFFANINADGKILINNEVYYIKTMPKITKFDREKKLITFIAERWDY